MIAKALSFPDLTYGITAVVGIMSFTRAPMRIVGAARVCIAFVRDMRTRLTSGH